MKRQRAGVPPAVAPPSGSRIHQGLVGTRTLIGTRYLEDPVLRSEYAREIAPRTEAALDKILRELFPNADDHRGPRRVLDLGAGTGAVSAAVRRYFSRDLDILAVDHVPAAPAVRAADVTDVPALARLVTAGGPFDLVIAAHVLNELFVEEEAAKRHARLATMVGRWCQTLLAEGGSLILLDPALRETSRALLAVRDHVLASGLHIAAPCFYSGPCPALLRDRDWCHDATAAPPVAVARSKGGHRVDFSYLVVRAAGEATTDATIFRVVSDPLPEKGRLRLFACGVVGRHAVIRLDRHTTPDNLPLAQLARGDIARVARTTFAQDGLRVGKDTTVSRELPRPRPSDR